MFGFIAGFLLGIYFWRCWTWPRVRKVKPGLNKDVILPHTENLELHHNTLSSCSQKVSINGTILRDKYSSNEIGKTQNEHLNIVCQNLNHL